MHSEIGDLHLYMAKRLKDWRELLHLDLTHNRINTTSGVYPVVPNLK
jgi:hypothetical protein